ncbi:hypothetical protein QN355_06420 [Cryobacterium sp. 10S3]|uniref:hypothetical protein n=1 Tax=Cryobacterium sp. 10S3 TaxID=3048582 RepID=UPI002AC9A031|nr:hypothetical protein [Cryobacterium sp. 10S3]MEB0286183.1 hypothetical protein [Cryobacterium sp. 10S3]WPX12241.1 hypothetical protein RHM57_11160 [Cryobacterium sp. 10S3]
MSRPTPPKTKRGQRAALDRALDAHVRWEQRTLADLRVAGWNFTTIEQARQHRSLLRKMESLGTDEQIELIARALNMKNRIKHTDERQAAE